MYEFCVNINHNRKYYNIKYIDFIKHFVHCIYSFKSINFINKNLSTKVLVCIMIELVLIKFDFLYRNEM